MNKQQFIDKKIRELKKMMYGDEALMTEKEKKGFREFFEKFIDDLKNENI